MVKISGCGPGGEVVGENGGEGAAEFLPVGAERGLLFSGDPVGVELEDGGSDAEAFEPAAAEGAGIVRRGAGAALSEPRVAAEERFEALHVLEVGGELGDGGAADVEFAVVVVVEFEREVRAETAGVHGGEP